MTSLLPKKKVFIFFPVKYVESNFARMRSFKQKGVNASVMYIVFFYTLFFLKCVSISKRYLCFQMRSFIQKGASVSG